MAIRVWETYKTRFCQHIGCDVRLEAEVVYPAEWLPETPPRIVAHRCSHGIFCNALDRVGCFWSGTNPLVDPFAEHG
ncbi:MAG: hypothetical protein RML93_10385 [Anaerolineales bacterium]|nr:hypothetical protein [Anaerolineales bacterium]MCS7246949.1 hypothetical protein [Anaerolineales bacterium]MDW8160760.1 hypothetical protein [Anaerolineales bacterium]MDW8447683.1 hypothetical protein [Anaerolineales bacterium]